MSAMNSSISTHGGARKGAGRPKLHRTGARAVSVRMTPKQSQLFVSIGGAKWLRELLDQMAVDAMRSAEAMKPAAVALKTKSGAKVKWFSAPIAKT